MVLKKKMKHKKRTKRTMRKKTKRTMRKKTKRTIRKKNRRKSKKHKHIISKKKYKRMIRGGGHCVGTCINDYNLQYNDNPILPDPKYLHNNILSNNMSGGGLMHDFGLGDLLTGYYQAGNALTNGYHTYKGNKGSPNPKVTVQPRLNKQYSSKLNHPDIGKSYSKYSNSIE